MIPEKFDPYHRWLGIPLHEQPANHYRLLGLSLFESNADVISEGADRQMRHVRTHQLGPLSAVSQRVLNEIAAAKICLLNPTSKAVYDATLRVPARDVSPVPPDAPTTQPSPACYHRSIAGTKKSPTTFVTLGIIMTASALFLVVLSLLNRDTHSREQSAQSTAITDAGVSEQESARPVFSRPTQRTALPDAVADTPDSEPVIQLAQVDEANGVKEFPLGESDGEIAARETSETEDSAAPNAKLPVPDIVAQKKAASLIAEVYKADYDSAKTPAQKITLAQKLVADGLSTKDDAAGRYVLLQIGSEIAAKQGDLAISFGALDHLAAEFEMDILQKKVEVAAKAEKVSDEGVLLLNAAIGKAVAEDRYEPAHALAAVVLKSVRESQKSTNVRLATARLNEIAQLSQEYESVKNWEQVLSKSPTDPEANLAVGKFRCFMKGDWKNGVAMLALGNDPKVKAAALLELGESPEPLKIGDAWWQVSEALDGNARSNVQAHSAESFRAALPTLSGLHKARVERLLAQVHDSQPATSTDNESPRPAGFKLLFNGQDLSGWSPTGDADSWKVRDGTIVGCSHRSFLLCNEGPLKDFELCADVKINSNGNSGIFFRANIVPGTVNPSGYEVELLGTAIDSRYLTGSIWGISPISSRAASVVKRWTQADKWFTVKIIAVGNRFRVFINGREVLNFVDKQFMHKEGHIVLQQNDPETTVQFRNIAVKLLK
jgi:hypothetical protein